MNKTKIFNLDLSNHQTLVSFVNNKLGAKVSVFVNNNKYELNGLRQGFEVFKFGESK